ncbi:hypothetical protein CVT25_002741 [Psilocybe cyanescens]|uniref:Uncharacterized protein n=1 Tax=Psilocybe cyanescens TaxID=93625 RepID=A0A409WLC8_PSICY|nr:hypothetical protein CVT25_002741 [Psilocybe cyanescens]
MGPLSSTNQSTARRLTQQRQQHEHELETQLARKDKIASLLTTRTTHLTKLSFPQSRLLHALDTLDAHAQENANLRRELGAMYRKVRACEEAKEGMQREGGVEGGGYEGRGATGHQPTPPPRSHSHCSSASHHSPPQFFRLRTPTNAPPLHQTLHRSSSARTHANPFGDTRGKSCETGGGVGRNVQKIADTSALISSSSSAIAFSVSGDAGSVSVPPSASPPVPVVVCIAPNLMDDDNEDSDANGEMSMELATPLF